MEKSVFANIQVQAEQVELCIPDFVSGMSEILNALWSVLVIFILLSAAAFWWRQLPQLMMAHFDVKTGASQRRVEQRQNPQGMELLSEIYVTKIRRSVPYVPELPDIEGIPCSRTSHVQGLLAESGSGRINYCIRPRPFGPKACVARESSTTVAPRPGVLLVWQRGPFREKCPQAQSEGYQR